MTGPVYPGAFGRRSIEWEIPNGADRELVHSIIYNELCVGIFTDRSRQEYGAVIQRLADLGCDAVALVCTVIPLLITDGTSPLPTIDSTRLLAKAAIDVALGSLPMPDWRGAPIK